MRSSVFVALVALFAISFISSCTHQPYAKPASGDDDNSSTVNTSQNGNTTTTTTPVDTGICFERDVLPIFISNCAKSGCHDAITQAEELVLNNYSNIMSGGITAGNSGASRLYQSLAGTNPYMPPYPNSKLTAAQQTIIQKWIDQGAINSSCASSCDTTTYTYAAVIKPIMTSNCIGCHNSTSASGRAILDTYAGVQAEALNGRLVGAVNGTAPNVQMPLGGNKLMSCQITQITKWVNAGAPNN